MDRSRSSPNRGTPRVDPAATISDLFASIQVAANYTATPEFRTIFEVGALPPAGPGQRTLFLPAAPALDEEYYVKDSTGTASVATPIVVDANGAVSIDGTLTKSITTAYGAFHLKYDGVVWRLL